MDALSDVLRVMRLRGGVYLQGEFFDPWCISVQADPRSCAPFLGETAYVIPYHFVVEGRMRVRVGNGPDLDMGPGEAVLLPHNDVHLLGSDLSRPPLQSRDYVKNPIDGSLMSIMLGEGGERTRIVCGFLGAQDVHANPIVAALPSMLYLTMGDGTSGDWVRSSFQYAAERIAAGRTGSEVMMSKLSELLFVDAIQRYVETLPEEQIGWLAGLRDTYISRALALLHARAGETWTVDALSREAGLSRSALAERFVNVLGMPPMQYLANWRIHVAAQELINSNKPIPQIAQEVGYESEASFTRAFKRIMKAPPAAWRRRHVGRPPTGA
ncbi:MAG: AraC family transcriptional regulator [Alphaproteobacteria bacterium]